MSLCGQSPLFVPTTVNAVIKNIDAVDVAATNLSCKYLSIDGKPMSGIWANIDSNTAGTTKFTGNVEATGTVSGADFYVNDNGSTGAFYLDAFHTDYLSKTNQISRYTSTGGYAGTKIGNAIYYAEGSTGSGADDPECGVDSCSFKLKGYDPQTTVFFADIGKNSQSGSTGTNRIGIKTTTPAYDLDVNGTTGLTGNVTAAGNITMSGTSASLTQSGTSATASLKALSCTTLAPSSTITQSGGSATLKATTVDSLTTAGNITMSGTSASLTQSGTSATASLKATTCASLTVSGTTTLKATTADSLTTSGSIYCNEIYRQLSPIYPIVRNSVTTKPNSYQWYLEFPSTATSVTLILSDMMATTAGMMYCSLGDSSGPLTTLYNGMTSFETSANNTLRSMTHGVPIMEVQSQSAWGVIEFLKTDSTYWGVRHQTSYGTTNATHGGGVWKGTATPTRVYIFLATANTGTLAYATTGSLSGTLYMQYA